MSPPGINEKVWAETLQPTYYLTAPGGIILGIFRRGREALAQARPGLEIHCKLGYDGMTRRVWPVKGGS